MRSRFVLEDKPPSPRVQRDEARHTERDTAPNAPVATPSGSHAVPRDDRLSARLGAAVAQRAPGQPPTAAAAAIDATAHEPIIQRTEESAKLLTKLAAPTIRPGPAVDVQKALVDKLDVEHESVFQGGAINLGGILIEEMPATDQELIEQAQLTALPKMVGGSPLRYISFGGLSRAAKVKELGFDRLLIENALKTMKDAEQLKYLRLAGLPNDDWKILIELHYFRERDMSATGMHKDTLGQTLFVNLNYHMGAYLGEGEMLIGPEIVVNPPVSPTHETVIKGSLPKEFRKDLKATRATLGDPTEIKTELVDPYGYVAFVDEAVHHATPLYGHRYVTPGELKLYLEKMYPAAFKAASTAYAKFANQGLLGNQGMLGAMWHYPFPSYLKGSVIDETDISKWQTWMEMVSADADRRLTRSDLKATMTFDEFDSLLEVAGEAKLDDRRAAGRAAGFHAASIPGMWGAAGETHEYPIRPKSKPPLKRTLSNPDFRKRLPPEPAAHVKRRFFRTWIRVIPKAMADELPRRLEAEAAKERELAVAKAKAEAVAKAKAEGTAQLQTTSS